MCIEIELDGEVYGSVRALEAALPKGVVLDCNYGWLGTKKDSCLCAIDVEETAVLNRLLAREVGSMYYEFSKDDERATE